MPTSLRTYHIDAKKKGEVKREANTNRILLYVFPLAIILYQVFKTKFEPKLTAFAGAVFVIAIIYLVYTIRKANKQVDSRILEIDDEYIRLCEAGHKDQQLRLTEINHLELRADGLKVLNSIDDFIMISNDFEGFEEINTLMEDKLAANKVSK